MKMKKYNAPSIAEAMKLIRADLGEDAVILNSKVVVTKKLFGLVKHKSFEVVAGVDTIEKKPLIPPLPDIQPTLQNQQPIVPEVVSEELPANTFATTQIQTQDSQKLLNDELKKELLDLKALMKSVQRQTIQSQYPDDLLPFIDLLKRQELSKELITEISDELFARFKQQQLPLTLKEMRQITEDFLRQKLSHLSIGGLTFDKKVVHVLGPTGVGKTTTIAKMAARTVLEHKKKIGFMTTDTYRIAAIEQLKTYAGLLTAPVEIVYSATDYKRAVEKLNYLDVIFVDTAGRNYKEAKYVEDVAKLMEFDEQSESFLVLTLTAKEKDLEAVIDQFANIPIDKFIFTKVDETNSIGTMFNLMIKYNKGLAYYTNGQEVPEDIEYPDLDVLFDLFFQGECE